MEGYQIVPISVACSKFGSVKVNDYKKKSSVITNYISFKASIHV